jgi:hypothetical protein
VKKYVLAAMLAASAASADAAVTFHFAGSEYEGAAVSGALTIDTDALAGANSADAPATNYYFATDDGASTSLLPFLSISFASAGTNPILLTAGDFTYQWLHGDPADGLFNLELDWQVRNSDGSVTSSAFTLSGLGLAAGHNYGGLLLPDFAQLGAVDFTARSGTGDGEIFDTISMGSISFAAPAPEVSTWATMVLGFGAVGATARRRSRVAHAA